MTYIFKWRRFWFWHKATVIGHGYWKEQDKTVLYFAGGSIREIKNWSKCECWLGTDWVVADKVAKEKQASEKAKQQG